MGSSISTVQIFVLREKNAQIQALLLLCVRLSSNLNNTYFCISREKHSNSITVSDLHATILTNKRKANAQLMDYAQRWLSLGRYKEPAFK